MESNENMESSCHLMVVVSQTFSAPKKEHLISKLNLSLGKVSESFKDLEKFLNDTQRLESFTQLTTDSEHKMSSHDEKFKLDVLINVTNRSFRDAILSMLRSECKHKYMILTTLENNSNGDFLLQDAAFTFEDFFLTINDDKDLIKQTDQMSNLNICIDSRVIELNKSWFHGLEKLIKNVTVERINAPAANADDEKADNTETPLEASTNKFELFTGYFKKHLNEEQAEQFMDVSKFTGTLRTNRPSLYIFPAKEGDAAFFTVNGYSMLINGGYDRVRPCFWRFVNMLQQVDSVLLTHNDTDSIGGITSFLTKKLSNPDIKPNVLAVMANLVASSASKGDINRSEQDILLDAIQKLNIKLVPLVKTNENLTISGQVPKNSSTSLPQSKYEHINLYSKLGHGSLDLYVLSPFVSSKEFKDFIAQQQNHLSRQLNQTKSTINYKNIMKSIPLSHLNSAVTLVVWLPCYSPSASSDENSQENQALRLLFTGNAPQSVVLNALTKLKDFDLLNHPIYKVKSNAPVSSNETSFNQLINSMKKTTSSSSGQAKPSSASATVAHKTVRPQTSGSKLNAAASKPTASTSSATKRLSEAPKSATSAHISTTMPQIKKSTSRTSTIGESTNGSTTRQNISTSKSTVKTSNSTLTKETKSMTTTTSHRAPAARKPPTAVKSETTKKADKEENPTSKIITKRNSAAPKKSQPSASKTATSATVNAAPKQPKGEASATDPQKVEEEEVTVAMDVVTTTITTSSDVLIQEPLGTDTSATVVDTDAVVVDGTHVTGRECDDSAKAFSSNKSESNEPNNWPNLSPVKHDNADQNAEQADLVDLNDDLITASIDTNANGDDQTTTTNPINKEEEEDLNKTHELPADSMEEEAANESNKTSEEDAKSVIEFDMNNSSNTAPAPSDANCEVQYSEKPISQDLIDSLKSMNIASNSHGGENGNANENGHKADFPNGNHQIFDTLGQSENFKVNEKEEFTNTNDPNNWNLLELPAPVNTATDEGAAEKAKTLSSTNSASKLNAAATAAAKSLGKCANPVYLEVAYIPAHGNVFYVDGEFFRRVRARYYVLSTEEPSELLLNSIIKGKECWDDVNAPLAILPTYESETLRRWYIKNEEELTKMKIEILPAAKSASLTMDDNPELSFELYKLDF